MHSVELINEVRNPKAKKIFYSEVRTRNQKSMDKLDQRA
jgi:hypothetical protein